MQQLHRFWQAAQRGDAAAVRQQLREQRILPDTRHHVTHSHLMLRLSQAPARSAAEDRRLRDVMRLLVKAGWTADVRHSFTRENALHELAWHPPWLHIGHRVRFLVHLEQRQPKLDNMLAARSVVGLLPEEPAAVLRPDMHRFLRRRRIAIAHATRNNAGVAGVALSVLQGALRLGLFCTTGAWVHIPPLQVPVTEFEERYRW